MFEYIISKQLRLVRFLLSAWCMVIRTTYSNRPTCFSWLRHREM